MVVGREGYSGWDGEGEGGGVSCIGEVEDIIYRGERGKCYVGEGERCYVSGRRKVFYTGKGGGDMCIREGGRCYV